MTLHTPRSAQNPRVPSRPSLIPEIFSHHVPPMKYHPMHHLKIMAAPYLTYWQTLIPVSPSPQTHPTDRGIPSAVPPAVNQRYGQPLLIHAPALSYYPPYRTHKYLPHRFL